MPEWWFSIPGYAKTLGLLVGVFLAGTAFAGWVTIPSITHENAARLDRVEDRVESLEIQMGAFIRRMDRWACIQIAEEEGTPIRACM